jgi:hypothetical protein
MPAPMMFPMPNEMRFRTERLRLSFTPPRGASDDASASSASNDLRAKIGVMSRAITIGDNAEMLFVVQSTKPDDDFSSFVEFLTQLDFCALEGFSLCHGKIFAGAIDV